MTTRDPGLRSWKPRWLQLGGPIRRIRASSTLCRRHVHWHRFSQFKTALETPNLSLHSPGQGGARQGRSEIGFRGGRVEQGQSTVSWHCNRKRILCQCQHHSQWIRAECLQTWRPSSRRCRKSPAFLASHPGLLRFRGGFDLSSVHIMMTYCACFSTLRSGQVGVPQTEPDSSDADAMQYNFSAQVARLGEEALGSGERDQETHSWGVFRHVGVSDGHWKRHERRFTSGCRAGSC